MSVGGKLGASLFALVFLIPFGGVGALTSYAVVRMLGDSHRAGGWVLVQARVEDALAPGADEETLAPKSNPSSTK